VLNAHKPSYKVLYCYRLIVSGEPGVCENVTGTPGRDGVDGLPGPPGVMVSITQHSNGTRISPQVEVFYVHSVFVYTW